MQRIVRWVGIGIAVAVGVVVLLAGTLHFVGSNRLNNAPAVAPRTVEVLPGDERALARGAHLATISSCGECHGADLGGEVFINEAPIGYVPAPNLTSGSGGVGARSTPEDWERAIRHGVGVDGRSLLIMPSYHYDSYSDADLSALITHLQALPPVDKDLGERRITFPGTIIFGLLAYNDVAAVTRIDHAAVGGDAPPEAATAEYGEYLINITSCGSCHGEALTGNSDPDSPPGPNITMSGELQQWSEAEFATALRTGLTPSGDRLDSEMPWPAYARLSDSEVAAIWAYLTTLEQESIE